jgi:hypothetical protein
MTQLRAGILVESAPAQSMARLEQFFTSLQDKDGVARIRLRVPTDGATRELSIDRAVRVEARRTRGEASLNDLMLIRWMPEGTGIFPTFEGVLIVATSDDGANVSSIELDGTYTPPFGSAGQVFDAIIGRRIAEATARELLKDLKRAIESPA